MYIYNSMKKYILIFGIFASLALTACGNGSTTTETTDSTATQVDTTAVTATDSTTSQIPTDSTSTEVK
ncbi:MAG: hypothetical protein RL728_834 [Bacteroidota bacterium]|jgi:ABC-type phosphate transport system substrate-binding protein